MKKKCLLLAISALLVVGLFCAPVGAAYSDTDGHWAQATISSWQAQGLLDSFASDSFQPNAPITRAEANQLINAVKSTSDDTASSELMTRQDVFVLLTTAFGLDTSNTAIPAFTDGDKVASWAVGSVNALTKAGVLSGYEDGSVGSINSVTRAEMITLLDRLVSLPSTLAGLDLVDSAHLVDFQFNADTKSYAVEVFEDVYGIQFTPKIEGAGAVTVTMSGSGIETTTEKVFAGGLFELKLNQAREANITGASTGLNVRGMEDDCDYVVTITDTAGNTYTINVHRPGSYKLVEKFVENPDGDDDGQYGTYGSKYTLYQKLEAKTTSGETRYMPYYLYLPEDFDPNAKYPVMIVPHGAGQFRNASDDVLIRTAQATSMVHYGKKCILIVPQGNDQFLGANGIDSTEEKSGWTITGSLKLNEYGEAVMDVLESLFDGTNPYSKDIKVDKDRIYVMGGSAGGAGASAFLYTYPDVFAAGIIVCPAILTDTEARAADVAQAVAEYNIPVYLVHSKADGGPGGVKFATSEAIVAEFEKLGYTNYKTVFFEGDSYTEFDEGDYYLQPNAHFSWVPFMDNEENLDWLLSQSK